MDKIKVKGWVKCELRHADGSLKEAWEDHNLVTTVGLNYLAAWLATASQSTKFMPYVGIGSGVVLPSIVDTTLGTETARVAGTITSSGDTYENVSVFGAGVATGLVSELGLFSASSGGTMFARQTFAPRVKDSTMILTITWNVTFS